MTTIVTSSPEEAAQFVRSGHVAAFPTETVYGLGANALDAAAVARIFEAKDRPPDNPLIVHLSETKQVSCVAGGISNAARELMEAFFPGPLTLVVPRHASLPEVVTAGLDTVGIRIPAHPIAQAFLTACAMPVAAPSANRSGRPSPTTWQAVQTDLDGRIPCILQGGRAPVGLESTVVDCTSTPPVVLRAGAVTIDQLRSVIPGVLSPDEAGGRLARSPGTRHRHYAPQGRLMVVDSAPLEPAQPAAFIGLTEPATSSAYALIETVDSLEAYAHQLFDFMRRCDEAGIAIIFCESVPTEGLGLAIMDRITRAAQS